jgi:MYXO-CTERM domain-containing protein
MIQGKVVLGKVVCMLAAAASLSSLACSPPTDGAAARAADPDAAVSFTQSALVTNPATWQNLWGSWPLIRYDMPMVYDSDAKKLVTFGGRAGTQGPYYADTWEWDDAKLNWNERTPSGVNASPAERSGHMMVYDTVRKKTFLFSGWQPGAGFYIPDQWEWDTTTGTWTERVLAGAQPSARYGGQMVWDPDRKVAVLFGGFDETMGRRNDVWEWNGTTWAERTVLGTKPAARWNHAMTYDTARKKMVIFGGNTGVGLASAGTYVNETWEWDGSTSTFTKVTTTGDTPYYYYGGFRLQYDPIAAKTFFYYDYNTGSVYDPVAATWKNIVWTRNDTAYYAGNQPAIVYNTGRSTTVVFGGTSNRTLWDLQVSDLTMTNRSAPYNGPIQRQSPNLAFDSKAGKLMLFGGYSSVDGLYKQDTWEWSGTDANWVNRTNANAKPPARRGGMMVYDTKRDQLILFGGYGAAYYNDVWTWTAGTRNWTQQTITGMQPGGTYNNVMFYDPIRDKCVLFVNYYTIWELDPGTWTWAQRQSSGTGVPTDFTNRSYYEVTYDTDRSKILFVGGYNYVSGMGNVYDGSVFEWDAATATYSKRDIPVGGDKPFARNNHAVSYDSGRRVVVLTAGYSQVTGGVTGPVNDSWEWDSTAGKWSETTPPTVKPLPRYQHLQVFDSTRATTLVFGGTVSADTTYGPQEIWQYIASSAPRPNGSGCSAATAASCASKNCVDGVCCAETAAQCNGTCKACNVAGKLGTCSDVPAGGGDDTCASDQACDANHQCKKLLGQACSVYTDCASGHCADGVCCDTDCNGKCKTCKLNNSKGRCANTPTGEEDPVTCESDPGQGRFCDATGTCTNMAKPTGKSCTASGQCASTYCIDGFCCNSACANTCYTCGNPGAEGYCQAIKVGEQDHSATTVCDAGDQYCTGGGACSNNKLPNGKACTMASQCGSNFCVDGICCGSACLGTCQACNVEGNEGSCVNLKAGSQDMSATVTCAGAQYCDAAGTCQSGKKANGLACTAATECGSNFCVDGVCCGSSCTDACYRCDLSGTGACTGVLTGGTDPTAAVPCTAPNYCTSERKCTAGKKPNGAVCTVDNECGSNFCVDGTCCESGCQGKCQTCANATGTCKLVEDGKDPRKSCTNNGALNAACAGTCDGKGACRYKPAGLACSEAGCQSDGFIREAGMCDGAGNCKAEEVKTMMCNGFRCYVDPADGKSKCKTDCAKDPDCADKFYCTAEDTDGGTAGQCPKAFDRGHACTRNTQCASGTCSDGVCCNINCDKCGSCNMPGNEGTCIPIPAGTDPEKECTDNASDPTGKCGGLCNGQARCTYPSVGTSCGTCKSCNGAGLCNTAPEDDEACGTVDCDSLDTSCLDYHDITTKRCAALGTCKAPNTAASCNDVTMTCQPEGGVPTDATGAAGSTGAPTDGSTDGGAPSSGGGCGCEIGGGPGAASVLPLGMLFATMLVRRRRKR